MGFFAGPIQLGPDGPNLVVLYAMVPWIGVMAAGYAFGAILRMEPRRRNRLCLAIGLGAIALFVVLRGLNLYGDPQPWAAGPQETDGPPPVPAAFAFLNTAKYPASLLFLLMTLGPLIAAIPWLEGPSGALGATRPEARSAVARWLTVFGRVPFFFYVLHIPLIHALALVVSKFRLGVVSPGSSPIIRWAIPLRLMGTPGACHFFTWGGARRS